MNQQIDNALGGYEESVATVGGVQGNCLANAGSAAAPDTLLEQIKELRPYGKFEDIAPAMAGRIIADAEKIEGLMQTIESQKQTNLTILKKASK